MQKYNIMIFPAGSEIGLELNRALKYSKFVNIFGATSVADHSQFAYENLITDIPYMGEKDFIEKINAAIAKYSIDYIYPAYDAIQLYLMQNQKDIDAQIISAPLATVEILRSKKRTYQYLVSEAFIPEVWEKPEDVKEFPVFVKPAESQGGQGARVVSSMSELELAVKTDSSLVISEYLPGEEYTVDCFTDKNGNLLAAKARSRERIRTGIAVHSKLLGEEKKILQIANRINQRFQFVGAWFFQIKKNAEGEYMLMEISPRIPGTNGLSRNTGINYPLLTLFVTEGFDVSVIDNTYGIVVDRAFYSAYSIDISYHTVYLDFDDTLIVNEKVNAMCICFLYQALEKGKRIILISKHSTNLEKDLEKWHIEKGIFQKIIQIEPTDEKYRYINDTDSIFIDDSFAERKKIRERIGIPVFDVDMIEALLDYR
ncbi:MAG: ATP-grasp domain-containing protein [Clostridiaceae bacterium]|nr:ATP-grasp domain-containing protein [Clostridiaceae bacterium]